MADEKEKKNDEQKTDRSKIIGVDNELAYEKLEKVLQDEFGLDMSKRETLEELFESGGVRKANGKRFDNPASGTERKNKLGERLRRGEPIYIYKKGEDTPREVTLSKSGKINVSEPIDELENKEPKKPNLFLRAMNAIAGLYDTQLNAFGMKEWNAYLKRKDAIKRLTDDKHIDARRAYNKDHESEETGKENEKKTDKKTYFKDLDGALKESFGLDISKAEVLNDLIESGSIRNANGDKLKKADSPEAQKEELEKLLKKGQPVYVYQNGESTPREITMAKSGRIKVSEPIEKLDVEEPKKPNLFLRAMNAIAGLYGGELSAFGMKEWNDFQRRKNAFEKLTGEKGIAEREKYLEEHPEKKKAAAAVSEAPKTEKQEKVNEVQTPAAEKAPAVQAPVNPQQPAVEAPANPQQPSAPQAPNAPTQQLSPESMMAMMNSMMQQMAAMTELIKTQTQMIQKLQGLSGGEVAKDVQMEKNNNEKELKEEKAEVSSAPVEQKDAKEEPTASETVDDREIARQLQQNENIEFMNRELQKAEQIRQDEAFARQLAQEPEKDMPAPLTPDEVLRNDSFARAMKLMQEKENDRAAMEAKVREEHADEISELTPKVTGQGDLLEYDGVHDVYVRFEKGDMDPVEEKIRRMEIGAGGEKLPSDQFEEVYETLSRGRGFYDAAAENKERQESAENSLNEKQTALDEAVRSLASDMMSEPKEPEQPSAEELAGREDVMTPEERDADLARQIHEATPVVKGEGNALEFDEMHNAYVRFDNSAMDAAEEYIHRMEIASGEKMEPEQFEKAYNTLSAGRGLYDLREDNKQRQEIAENSLNERLEALDEILKDPNPPESTARQQEPEAQKQEPSAEQAEQLQEDARLEKVSKDFTDELFADALRNLSGEEDSREKEEESPSLGDSIDALFQQSVKEPEKAESPAVDHESKAISLEAEQILSDQNPEQGKEAQKAAEQPVQELKGMMDTLQMRNGGKPLPSAVVQNIRTLYQRSQDAEQTLKKDVQENERVKCGPAVTDILAFQSLKRDIDGNKPDLLKALDSTKFVESKRTVIENLPEVKFLSGQNLKASTVEDRVLNPEKQSDILDKVDAVMDNVKGKLPGGVDFGTALKNQEAKEAQKDSEQRSVSSGFKYLNLGGNVSKAPSAGNKYLTNVKDDPQGVTFGI